MTAGAQFFCKVKIDLVLDIKLKPANLRSRWELWTDNGAYTGMLSERVMET